MGEHAYSGNLVRPTMGSSNNFLPTDWGGATFGQWTEPPPPGAVVSPDMADFINSGAAKPLTDLEAKINQLSGMSNEPSSVFSALQYGLDHGHFDGTLGSGAATAGYFGPGIGQGTMAVVNEVAAMPNPTFEPPPAIDMPQQPAFQQSFQPVKQPWEMQDLPDMPKERFGGLGIVTSEPVEVQSHWTPATGVAEEINRNNMLMREREDLLSSAAPVVLHSYEMLQGYNDYRDRSFDNDSNPLYSENRFVRSGAEIARNEEDFSALLRTSYYNTQAMQDVLAEVRANGGSVQSPVLPVSRSIGSSVMSNVLNEIRRNGNLDNFEW